mmetsp:Transcript_4294/g.9779  ORF Transcript_4294/g.9779 Transcript_4294/m.9779 type:complete len:310 (+) Transcript_4294:206-1135(+)
MRFSTSKAKCCVYCDSTLSLLLITCAWLGVSLEVIGSVMPLSIPASTVTAPAAASSSIAWRVRKTGVAPSLPCLTPLYSRVWKALPSGGGGCSPSASILTYSLRRVMRVLRWATTSSSVWTRSAGCTVVSKRARSWEAPCSTSLYSDQLSLPMMSRALMRASSVAVTACSCLSPSLTHRASSSGRAFSLPSEGLRFALLASRVTIHSPCSSSYLSLSTLRLVFSLFLARSLMSEKSDAATRGIIVESFAICERKMRTFAFRYSTAASCSSVRLASFFSSNSSRESGMYRVGVHAGSPFFRVISLSPRLL